MCDEFRSGLKLQEEDQSGGLDAAACVVTIGEVEQKTSTHQTGGCWFDTVEILLYIVALAWLLRQTWETILHPRTHWNSPSSKYPSRMS